MKFKGSFSAEKFLAEYWQKKPLYIPQLIPDFVDLLSADELAGLACESAVESRIVLDVENDWQLKHGPFNELSFSNLPENKWTLLVQAVDIWVPEVARLKQLFDFIPSWRIDDVMVSYASNGGGVGPHFDYYDVFLIQGSGSRSWQIGEMEVDESNLKQGNELKILTNFCKQSSHVLKAGDALYLPPRYAHWGQALDSGICYSVGFRAPSLAEMLEGYSDELIRPLLPGQRFVDSDPQCSTDAAAIDPDALEVAFKQLQDVMDNKYAFWRWFGCQSTRPRYADLIVATTTVTGAAALADLLNNAREISRHPASRYNYLEVPNQPTILLFVDGIMHTLPANCSEALHSLCCAEPLTADLLLELAASETGSQLLCDLINQGSLQLD